MFTSKASIIIAALAFSAAFTYAAPIIRHDVSLNSRATNVQLNLGPHDSTGPQLLTREFDYKLNTRDAFELNARYPGDDDLYAHEPYEGGYESGSEHDPDVHATPEAPGASLLHGHPIAHPPTKKYKVAKALKTAGVAAGRKVVEVAKATKERLWRPQNKYRVVARSEQPNGGASDSSKAKRAESGNWKRDFGHSLGLDANYFWTTGSVRTGRRTLCIDCDFKVATGYLGNVVS